MLSWFVRLRYAGVNPDEFNTFSDTRVESQYLYEDVDLDLKIRIGNGGWECSYRGFGNGLANTLVGGEGNDCLYGMAGNDTLSGGDGVDYLEGGKGQDNLFGGAGDDTFFIMGEDTAYDVFDGGTGIDTIEGGTGNDTFRVHQFSGLHSIERIIGGGGENVVAGTDLADTINLAGVTEIAGIARIEGGAGEDIIKGNGADNTLFGGSLDHPEDFAQDRLEGGAGNDAYHVGLGDIVNDSDGQGTLWHDGSRLSPMILTRLAQSDVYFDEKADTAAIIDRATGTLTLYAGGDLEFSIEHFISGNLGIILQEEKTDDHTYAWKVSGSALTDVFSPGVYVLNGIGGEAFERRTWDDRNANYRFDGDEEYVDISWQWLHSSTDNFLIAGAGGGDYLQGFKGYDHLQGGEGDDMLLGWSGWLYSNPTFCDTGNILDGGGGNDSLWGAADQDHMMGGLGDDILSGVLGRDILAGDGGNDVLAGGSDSDMLAGGEGQDILLGDSVAYSDSTYVIADQAFSVNFTYFANGLISSFTPVNFIFSPNELGSLPSGIKGGNDILDGGGGRDWLNGEAGNDILKGGKGQDTVIGGTGDDRLWGEDENDVLVGDNLNDEAADDGNDYLAGGSGDDELQGQGGADTLYGDAGIDRLFGGSGSDDLHGGAGDDELSGGDGDDTLAGGTGSDRLFGDNGVDVIDGGNDEDMLFGGDNDDILTGGAGNDVIDGGPGNDRYMLQKGSGIDRISDTAGCNTLIFDANTEMEVTFGAVSANGMVVFSPASTDLVIRYGESDVVLIENGRYGRFDFRIGDISYDVDSLLDHMPQFQEYGPGSKKVTGSSGNDRIYAGDGNDTVNGGAGNDSITGGTGFDPTFREFLKRIEFLEKNGIPASGLSYGGKTNERHYRDTIYGDAGNDAISGGWGNDRLYGGDGDDALHGGRDNDDLCGGPGNDVLDGDVGIDWLYGGDGDDILDGGEGIDNLFGESGSDRLIGGPGDDTVLGGPGNDLLEGGTGDDHFYGDPGSDVIDGGSGSDLVDYQSSPAGIRVDLTAGRAAGGDAEGDTLKGIEAICGSSFSDVLIGDDGDNRLGGYGGDDIIYGGAGNDELDGHGLVDGGAGNDHVSGVGTLYGGAGDDQLVGWSEFSFRTRNELDGGDSDDILTGHHGHDLLRGGDGDDVLDGGGASAEYGYEPRSFDLLEGGAGNDTYVLTRGLDFIDDRQGINTIRLSGGGWETISPWYVTFQLVSVNLDELAEMMTCVDSWDNLEENARLDAFRGRIFDEAAIDPRSARDLLMHYGDRAAVIVGGATDLGYMFEIGDDGEFLSQREVLLSIAASANALPEVECSQTYDLSGTCQLSGRIDATDPDGDTLVYTLKESPDAGDLAVEADGSWLYTAQEDFVGTDSASIDIDDGSGDLVSVVLTFNIRSSLASPGNPQQQASQGFLSDAIAAAVSAGNPVAWGTEDADQLIGSGGDDVLVGLAGNDLLSGNLGNDTLAGGEGGDVFVFDSSPDAICNQDTVIDFLPGSDMIRLDSKIFTALAATGVLSDAYFRSGAAARAEDEDDYILYNTTSGALLYDADGSGHGVAIEIASLMNKPALTAGDLLVIA
jgi:Ca2+-binding RTX toxin-like protein